MSMKKAIDQTLRDLKRGVNKKVLKVPSIEQKVLDATSNEPWGPHGSLLADIAQATRNYHEYQMIMSILWKRLNDTGKNWRHVYKALTVLEYLVANGSERVIDEIKEHAYQISTLSDFQYIDSSGRDQGNNVRRKSQSLVLLVNDKERIQEARDKAATNRDKFHSTSAGGGMYRPGSHSGSRGYGDDRHESQYDERYGRYGDPGDRYGRDFDDYGRDRYGDDDSRGRARSVDGYRHGSRSRSSDRDGDRSFEDDDRHSARGNSVRGENHPDGRPIERKFSEQNLGAPPTSYEEAVDISQSPAYSDRDGETPPVSAPQSSSPTINAAPHSSFPVTDATPSSSSPNSVNPTQLTADHDVPSHPNIEAHGFDEFDPRASFPAAPVPTSANAGEMDLLGSLSDAFSSSPLAIMPASNTSDVQPDFGKTDSHPSFIAASENNVLNQPFEDPFGDSPFKAIPSEEAPSHPPNFAAAPSIYPDVNPSEPSQPTAQKVEAPNLEFADTFSGLSFHPATPDIENPPNQQYLSEDDDILAGILPPAPLHRATSLGAFPASSGVPSGSASYTAFPPTSHTPAGHGFMTQVGSNATPFSQTLSHSFSFSAPSTPFNPHLTNQGPRGASIHQNNDLMGDMLPSSQLPSSNSTGSLSLVSLEQSSKEKFEPKSAVWADTLSRGLVNLNISGSKINPLSDIGIDFESLNRKEKRMEKPSVTPATSNVNMGKAMGSGSGMGRAGVGGMRPPPNPMMGSGMGMGGSGMGMGIGMGGSGIGMGGSGAGMGMGGYGSMNQQPMGMGMGGMGMGMNNMGMAQGVMMQPPNGSGPGPNMNYNPMMGRGGYPQQPYGGAYRSM